MPWLIILGLGITGYLLFRIPLKVGDPVAVDSMNIKSGFIEKIDGNTVIVRNENTIPISFVTVSVNQVRRINLGF